MGLSEGVYGRSYVLNDALGWTLMTRVQPLPEHSMVRTLCEIKDKKHTVPKGAVGAIVGMRHDGHVYDVEFDEPENVVVVALRSELEPA